MVDGRLGHLKAFEGLQEGARPCFESRCGALHSRGVVRHVISAFPGCRSNTLKRLTFDEGSSIYFTGIFSVKRSWQEVQ